MDDLVERTAREMCRVNGINPDEIGLGMGGPHGMPKDSTYPLWQAWERLARAIIPMVLEEAAKVADRHDTGDMRREDMEARRIAAAIRAMGAP